MEEELDHDPHVAPRWYACQVMSRAEKKVARHLEDNGIESFLPLIVVKSQWKDRQKLVRLPLFRGYVFARFTIARYGEVLRIPRVASVVRMAGAPAPIPDEEIENIRQFAERLENADVSPQPAQRFVEGQRVQIAARPFEGAVEGIVTELRSGRPVSVFVGVQLIGQYVRIRIRAEDLEPLDLPPAAAI
jgi:transcription antitermination factor NusG